MASSSDSLLARVEAGAYIETLLEPSARTLVQSFTTTLLGSNTVPQGPRTEDEKEKEKEEKETGGSEPPAAEDELAIGLAAFNAFLQINVTGPALEPAAKSNLTSSLFASTAAESKRLRASCIASLEVDGVSPYPYIPHIELFAFARHVVRRSTAPVSRPIGGGRVSLAWLRLRVLVWHFRLLAQPSLSGTHFSKAAQWIDVPSLAEEIVDALGVVRAQLFGEGEGEGEDVWDLTGDAAGVWSREEKVRFLLEAANVHVMLGRDDRAREAVAEAARLNGFAYALSGALGKRTRWQEKSTSQLVVLAKSGVGDEGTDENDEEEEEAEARPEALLLNDDTLLENIEFSNKGTNGTNGHGSGGESTLPPVLADLSPDNQPQLSPLDQIILLTEATIKDSFSPVDTLTSEEVLPYAVRVITDKSTNWQVYTQALLVRSRIEVHRSRTIERGVLQMQAVVDQVIVDTDTEQASQSSSSSSSSDPATTSGSDETKEADVPAIAITAPDQREQPKPAVDSSSSTDTDKPTSFFPAPQPTESAPAHVRLDYIHALASPPRWHLESELAYSWVGVGSLVSALEIFKRLRLWAEVAVCLASAANTAEADGSGRGSGGEEKAKGIIRWRLFHRTGTQPGENTTHADPDAEVLPDDPTRLDPSLFSGPERNPLPPNAPRLFCILGDLESDPSHYERAWSVSNQRYARAQKSLGEHYLSQKTPGGLEKAREAYAAATRCNRLSPELWSRFGDISLRLGLFDDAADAYSRAIASAGDPIAGEDARTWSNLGSALWSLHLESVKLAAAQGTPNLKPKPKPKRDPAKLLAQSLSAYKRGATLASSNWRIWDNVLTLASRARPPAYADMVHALRSILRIRASETAIDIDLLRALVQDTVLARGAENGAAAAAAANATATTTTTTPYEPPRGSIERAVLSLLEDVVAPLITARSDLWALVSRARVWRGDYKGGIDAAEKAWRAAMGTASASSGLLAGSSSSSTPAGGAEAEGGARKSWLEDAEAWDEVVSRTAELVGVLENFGEGVDGVGSRWKSKGRSAVRSVMSKARDPWEGSEGWKVLEGLMEGLEK
ncbi:hypothetical protein SODALDRAFT_326104 [Sodiomyces alkalinus F11]|uniref:TPR-like protein n=1 Tax=Sodiomyces alkalinus (strain CBS 110278 / VKM F-3762 / F11) TaxID=1314773 RepID=A0A3N2Q576_SODAK|nr:hypothetical protein SODALDRAFT_326104 [Sodiomyces alkalinus F11]ROT41921.1 hypothetical protein SODALDRAFT_326104 [Sodiomyces alkalinus F11]